METLQSKNLSLPLRFMNRDRLLYVIGLHDVGFGNKFSGPRPTAVRGIF